MLGASTRIGRAAVPLPDLRTFVLAAWDDFLEVVDGADLARDSRLRGLSARDVLVHLGTWDDHLVLPGLVSAARTGSHEATVSPDDVNRALLARHREAGDAEVRAALERSRSELAAWLDSPEAGEVGHAFVSSAVGRLPLLSVLHAGCYELAVHAMDLRADRPSERLLDHGLAALIDVTGALAAQHGIAMSLTAQAPQGGWSFTSGADGWSVARVTGPFSGPGVRGDAAVLLDASAGRVSLPPLLARRKLKVQDMRGFLRLAPMIDAVPSLPGGPVLRAGVRALSKLFA
jgi:hypothetical protein